MNDVNSLGSDESKNAGLRVSDRCKEKIEEMRKRKTGVYRIRNFDQNEATAEMETSDGRLALSSWLTLICPDSKMVGHQGHFGPEYSGTLFITAGHGTWPG